MVRAVSLPDTRCVKPVLADMARADLPFDVAGCVFGSPNRLQPDVI